MRRREKRKDGRTKRREEERTKLETEKKKSYLRRSKGLTQKPGKTKKDNKRERDTKTSHSSIVSMRSSRHTRPPARTHDLPPLLHPPTPPHLPKAIGKMSR